MIYTYRIIAYNTVYSSKLGEAEAKFEMICQEPPAAEDQFDEEDEEAWWRDDSTYYVI